jgi:hypothetical protein
LEIVVAVSVDFVFMKPDYVEFCSCVLLRGYKNVPALSRFSFYVPFYTIPNIFLVTWVKTALEIKSSQGPCLLRERCFFVFQGCLQRSPRLLICQKHTLTCVPGKKTKSRMMHDLHYDPGSSTGIFLF